MSAAHQRGEARVAAAVQTTDRVEEMIRDALTALNADRGCNGLGVYIDRSAVRSNLLTAKVAIHHAIALIGVPTVWPDKDDYDGVEP